MTLPITMVSAQSRHSSAGMTMLQGTARTQQSKDSPPGNRHLGVPDRSADVPVSEICDMCHPDTGGFGAKRGSSQNNWFFGDQSSVVTTGLRSRPDHPTYRR
ncbi:MAG: hypothetical protein QGD91_10115 [Actinomycetota bacterium]|nr:hypothetical protein [Actinomycetota bacterium]